jgi:hypothetical protein
VRLLAVLRDGLRSLPRHVSLVPLYWVCTLLPALALTCVAAAVISPALGRSLFADRLLAGDWLPVWRELRVAESLTFAAPAAAIALAFLATAFGHAVLAGGVVAVLLDRRGQRRPLIEGMAANTPAFLRATAWFLAAASATMVVLGALAWGFTSLAETHGDARWDMAGLVVVVALAFFLLTPLALAHDLTRLAAARHGQGSTLLGFARSIGVVLRRPDLFVPLGALLLLLPAGVHVGLLVAGRPARVATPVAIAALAVAHQLVMLLRAGLKVFSWGTMLACYRMLGEPELCRPRAATSALAATSAPAVDVAPVAGVGTPE